MASNVQDNSQHVSTVQKMFRKKKVKTNELYMLRIVGRRWLCEATEQAMSPTATILPQTRCALNVAETYRVIQKFLSTNPRVETVPSDKLYRFMKLQYLSIKASLIGRGRNRMGRWIRIRNEQDKSINWDNGSYRFSHIYDNLFTVVTSSGK